MDKIKRQSNYELLRIVSIMLIMMMHSFGKPLSSVNEYVVIAVTVIGNIGTTCFIILSGYFGIKRNIKKLAALDIMIIAYSLCEYGIDYMLTGEMSLKELISCIIPITSHRYWFLSCYFFLCILSPYINEYIEGLSKKRMEGLIATLLLLFALLPTVFGFDVMQDGGKGLVNMTLAYIIGRYLRIWIYDKKESITLKTSKQAAGLLCLIIVNFALNAGAFALTGSDACYYARDNSVFTIAQSVLLFMLFSNIKLKSGLVNAVAANVVAAYVFEAGISHVIRSVWDYTMLADRAYYVLIVTGVVVFTFAVAVIIEFIRKMIFGRAEQLCIDKAADYIEMRKISWKR